MMYAIKVKHDGTPLTFKEFSADAKLLTFPIKDKPYWVVAELVKPPLGKDQVYEGPTLDVANKQIIYTARDKTPEELADEQRRKDITQLRNAGKDVALVLAELIEWALANAGLNPADFSPDVRKAFQDLKAIADRLR